VWIFLWFVASAFILGVFGWSLVILQQQKRAWAAFAKKHSLAYVPGKLVEAPVIKGAVFGYQVAMFPDVQSSQDQRGQRFVTVMEFDLGAGGVTGAVIASANFATFIAGLAFNDTIDVDFPEWDKTRIIRTRNKTALKEYLTTERLTLLHSIMNMKNSSALYFFDEQNAILHIETSDPIRDAARMEKIIQRITSSLDKLKPTADELARLTQ
jgi:hypothetical protein